MTKKKQGCLAVLMNSYMLQLDVGNLVSCNVDALTPKENNNANGA